MSEGQKPEPKKAIMSKINNPTLPGAKISNQHPKENIHAIIKIVAMDGVYVASVRCAKYHGGNDRLAGPTAGYYQCCGCGEFFPAAGVLGCQRGPVGGEKGQGGIRRVK